MRSSSIQNRIRPNAFLGDGLGAVGRDPRWRSHRRVAAACSRAVACAPVLAGQTLSCGQSSSATKGPTRLGMLLIALAIALPATPLAGGTANILARLLGLATICLLGWIALTALHIAADLYLMRFRLDVAGQSACAQTHHAGSCAAAGAGGGDRAHHHRISR